MSLNLVGLRKIQSNNCGSRRLEHPLHWVRAMRQIILYDLSSVNNNTGKYITLV